MTMMDVTFRLEGPLNDAQIRALAKVPDVYGIRKLRVDEPAARLRIEYDATRLDEARVTALVRGCGVAVQVEREAAVAAS